MILKDTGTIPTSAVPVQALSEHLRLGFGFADDAVEDALLERLLRQAIGVVEQRSGLALIRRRFELDVDSWDRRGHLLLPIGPVAAVDEITLRLGQVSTSLAPGNWRLSPGTARQRLTGRTGGALPALAGDLTATLGFDAGFGPAWADVPEDLQRAVLMLAAHFYEYRDAVQSDLGLPAGVMALIDLRRPVRL